MFGTTLRQYRVREAFGIDCLLAVFQARNDLVHAADVFTLDIDHQTIDGVIRQHHRLAQIIALISGPI
ncbi:hypothetical protein [Pseudomonas sp. RA_35y_Pfl2_P32]|uniref:hypothetical protein n=1 Tax=Pseudomonas sp. RA_35y_Pfl2_P32 TaxID=3088705 RepID=UPI0030D87F2C